MILNPAFLFTRETITIPAPLKKKLLIFFFFLNFFSSFAVDIRGTVKDARDKKPLAFCAVIAKRNGSTCISNEDGVYKITGVEENDTIVFSYVGYKQKQIPVQLLIQSPGVLLEAASTMLSEVVVHGRNDFLFDLMDRCRKKIIASATSLSKVYFLMQTDIEGSPVEMMECYYNGSSNAHKLEKLSLKNGRVGIAETQDHQFFLSENTAHALALLNLTGENENLPGLPLQFNAAKQKKIFTANNDYSFSDSTSWHIVFSPREANGKFFSGEVWIDVVTYDLIKIILKIDNAYIHPFVPVWHEDALSNVSLFFSETFAKHNTGWYPENINFNYHLFYHSNMAFRAGKINAHITAVADTAERVKQISTSGSFTFYDFEKGFKLPFYEYDAEETDYRKILSIPFNASFWEGDPRLEYSEKQKQALSFFNANGVLINYRKNDAMKTVAKLGGKFFDGVNILWSDTNRLSLTENNLDSVLKKDSLSVSRTFRIDQYRLKTQLFFDINASGDSLSHLSAAIFDVKESFYNLPEEPFTNCFLNIYFDLAEVERRTLENVLLTQAFSILQMDSLYLMAKQRLSVQSEAFIKETESGQNPKGLLKWNNYILDNLGIDNMKIFGLK